MNKFRTSSRRHSTGAASRSLAPIAAGCLLAFSAPIAMAMLPPQQFVAITAAGSHTCVISNYGHTYCWGLNDVGQTGLSSSTRCSNVECVDRPTFVLNASKVDAGARHTCALDASGAAYCWGNDDYGQLGGANGLRTTRVGVSTVAGGLVFSSISAGSGSTCGVTAGSVFCWGSIVGWSSYPTRILGGEAVDVGGNNACAAFTLNRLGRVASCWGSNESGQIGVPASSTPVPPAVRSSFSQDISRISLQTNYACADLTAGVVQCLGNNGSGQLGNGSKSSTHLAQTVGNGAALRGVSTGGRHACALDPIGRAFCWGDGRWGQLGNGFTNEVNSPPGESLSPTEVIGGRTYRAIAAGALHTCAIGNDNRIYCWGSNKYGQIGAQIPQVMVPLAFSVPIQALDP